MVVSISESRLRDCYLRKGMTDSEIAQRHDVGRTTIVRLRKKYQIETRNQRTYEALDKVIERLHNEGFTVENQKAEDKTAVYDLLVEGHIRVEVLGAHVAHANTFRYVLSEQESLGHVESQCRVRFASGRTRKLYHRVCDYVICIGCHNDREFFWIIPANEIRDSLQTLSLPLFSQRSKYLKYRNAWHLLGATALVSVV